MQDSAWQDLVGRIKDTFEVLEEGDEPLVPGPGHREFITFQGPAGTMLLERITRPVVLGQRGMGGKRVGAGSSVAYEYSDSEETQSVELSKKSGDTWIPIDLDVGLGL